MNTCADQTSPQARVPPHTAARDASARHAAVRAQQLAIPPIVDRLLDEFGEEEFVGQGSVRVFFSRRSIKKMERAFGHQPARLFMRYTRAYRIESTTGAVITKGWQTGRLWRR